MDLETQLKSALSRKEPPPGFTAKVMERARSGQTSVRVSHRPWRAIAAAVMLTAVIGGWTAHEISERRQGERAREEVLLALHIAGEKVHDAQKHVQEIGSKR